MPSITTWSGFSKRRNSTKQPSATGTVVDVKLKEDTSIESPVFILQGDQFNVDYVQAFGAYYFVSNIISLANGLTELHCEKDVLATYKSQIGSTNAFILYATGGNNNIQDRRLSMTAPPVISTTDAAFPWTIDPLGDGTYLLTVMGIGGVQTFAMSYTELTDFMSDLSTLWDDLVPDWAFPPIISPNPGFQDMFAIVQWYAKIVGGFLSQVSSYKTAPDCLIDCIWIPISYTGGTNNVPIYLGKFNTNHQGRLVGNSISSPGAITLNIPWNFTDWRNASPFTELIVYIPFVGVLHYDTSEIWQESQIRINFSLARCSGDCSVEVSAGNVKLGTYALNLKAHYPIGTMTTNPVNQLTSVVGGVMGIGTGIATGGVAPIIGGAVGGVAGTLTSFNPTPSTVGGLGGGSGAGLDNRIRVAVVSHDTAESPGASNATQGKPVMATHTISNYSGYIQASGASVAISGESVDRDAINAFLNGGFFYE